METKRQEEIKNWLQAIDFAKDDGLLPAIVQDADTGEVLMLAYVNREALQKTIETKTTWFWSRSRKALWNKGETSGNIQDLVDVRYDCDNDTFLYIVRPQGPACHTGNRTCFYRSIFDDLVKRADDLGDVEVGIAGKYFAARPQPKRLGFLYLLEEFIKERKKSMPEGSYTTYLFDEGLDKILKKVAEESGEVIIAAKNNSKEELVYETADLIYHLTVLLQNQGLDFDDIIAELESRHQVEIVKK